MAIKRSVKTTNNLVDDGGTSAPLELASRDQITISQTADIKQVQTQYQQDAESNKEDHFDTGALLPRDMTVKLVRAESANWETFLSCFYSITLTLFGLFLGSWVSSRSTNSNFSGLERIATIAFGVISILLIIVWITLKVRQQKHGIKIPYETLNSLTKKQTE